jgi:hypothetical protein
VFQSIAHGVEIYALMVEKGLNVLGKVAQTSKKCAAGNKGLGTTVNHAPLYFLRIYHRIRRLKI